MRSLRLLAFSAVALSAAAAAVAACSSDDDAPGAGSPDASADHASAHDGGHGGGDDDAEAPADGGLDAKADAKAGRDANGPGEAGAECVFNHDCQLALRCSACDAGYCFCEPGARGAGDNGVDACDSGDQCRSSLCVEETCSDACESNDDCTGKLPRCYTVPGFAKFCAPPSR